MNDNNTVHPVELLLVAAVVTLEALALVLTALVALLLTVACWRPAAAAHEAPPAPPLEHPLIELADTLQALPQRELMALVGTRRRLPKRQLAALLVAC